MKFRGPHVPAPASPGGGYARPYVPQWLKEWRDSLPKFVELACGHTTDVALPAVLVVKGFEIKEVQVWCEESDCDGFRVVVKRLNLCEYNGIAAAPIPDEPLF